MARKPAKKKPAAKTAKKPAVPAVVKPEPNKGGRPPKLEPDARTLAVVRGLGQIQAVSKEIAAVLGVTEPTWIKFKADHAEVREALEAGQGEGQASLRRRQLKSANDGNTTMLIWLGKQYLGQRDRVEHTGKDGGPIQTEEVSAREKLSRRIAGIAARKGAKPDSGKPD